MNKKSLETEKLHKVLAHHGYGSRREMEHWIQVGRVHVNGKAATLGDRVSEKDRIEVDGKLVDRHDTPAKRVILYHKQEGEICTRNDPEGRPTVFDNLPHLKSGRWVAVGRLDINSSGLMIFTTDGELANKLMHPSSNIDREYAVRVFGEVTHEIADILVSGLQLEDGFSRFEHIVGHGHDTGMNHWYYVVCMSGRNRIVRRMFEAVELPVNRLTRVRFGKIKLEKSLRPGECQEISVNELKGMIQA